MEDLRFDGSVRICATQPIGQIDFAYRYQVELIRLVYGGFAAKLRARFLCARQKPLEVNTQGLRNLNRDVSSGDAALYGVS